MFDESDAIPREGAGTVPRAWRLAWRWKESGTSGRGPWMHRPEVVAAWAESLNLRWHDRVDHWIEEADGSS